MNKKSLFCFFCMCLLLISPFLHAEEIKEFDRDNDGKIDEKQFFDDKGKLVKAEVDTDNNFNFDQRILYENGVLYLIEVDTNKNDIMDEFRYYDKDMKLLRAELDPNEDGIIDKTIKGK